MVQYRCTAGAQLEEVIYPYNVGLLGLTGPLCTNIVSLDIDRLTDTWELAALAYFRRLRRLHFCARAKLLPDQGDLDRLAGMTALQDLSVRCWDPREGMYTSLMGFQRSPVTRLCLQPCTGLLVDSPVLCNLQHLSLHSQQNMRRLDLSMPSSLSGLAALQHLSFFQVRLTGNPFSLASLPRLKSLELKAVRMQQPDTLNGVLTALTLLSSLSIDSCSFQLVLHDLVHLTALTKFAFRGRADKKLGELDIPTVLTNLVELDLSLSHSHLSQSHFTRDVTHFSCLTLLDLSCQAQRMDSLRYSGGQMVRVARSDRPFKPHALRLNEDLLAIVRMPRLRCIRLGQVDGDDFTPEGQGFISMARQQIQSMGGRCEIDLTVDIPNAIW